MTKPAMFITGIMSTIIGIDAFAAPSVRTGMTANMPTQTIARAGTLRSGSARTGAITKKTVQTSAAQKNSSSTTAQDSNAYERLAANKKSKVPSKTISTTPTKDINSRIDEIQNAIEAERDNSAKKDEVYTREQIDELLVEINNKIPKMDDRGNMTWTDPNGNLVVVHMGDVVIGGDDVIVVDGNLSTTSTNPIQNQAVTNALNEKQNKSTSLSFGDKEGGWTPVTIGSDYIELHTNQSNAKEIRIRPTMIATSLDNMDNEGQLITAGAVQDALNALATNTGSGTQPEPFFNLINLETKYDSLVKRYTYQTDASYSGMLAFALEFCDGTFSEKWCYFHQVNENKFQIVKRDRGHYLQNYDIHQITTTSSGVSTTELYRYYKLNISDDTGVLNYVQNNLCTNRDICIVTTVIEHANQSGFNEDMRPIYSIIVYSEVTSM